ncbi:MAG: hypothetical protein ACLTRS_13840 [Lachnospiraceae bacterium]
MALRSCGGVTCKLISCLGSRKRWHDGTPTDRRIQSALLRKPAALLPKTEIINDDEQAIFVAGSVKIS